MLRIFACLFALLLFVAASPGDVHAAADGLHSAQTSAVQELPALETAPQFEAEDAMCAQADSASSGAETQLAQRCCRVCTRGKPCGNSCINRNYTCRQPPGCAC